ncbi:MAG: transglycosylase domain-containing protein, partial [Rhodobiaceae bacterium]|nr:transglycosylase domain-containing protein [Rhodobiaceae bacterium]
MNSDFRLYPEDRVSVSPEPRRERKQAAPLPRKSSGHGPVPPGRGGGRGGRPAKRKKKRGAFWFIGKLVKFGFVLAFLSGLAVAGILGYYASKLPPPSEMAIPERPANVKIVAMDGTVIANRGPTGGEAVRLFELPAYLPQAVMAIEDRRFYSHYGIDLLGLARAMI